MNQQIRGGDLEICISSKFPCDADAAGLRTALRTTDVVVRNRFLESVSLNSNTGSITKDKYWGKSLGLSYYCSSIPAS